MTRTGAGSAVGTFTASGALADSGRARQIYAANRSTVRGATTLEGTAGTIVVRFTGRMTPALGGITILGRWAVVDGTSAYASLRANGALRTTIDNATADVRAIYAAESVGRRG